MNDNQTSLARRSRWLAQPFRYVLRVEFRESVARERVKLLIVAITLANHVELIEIEISHLMDIVFERFDHLMLLHSSHGCTIPDGRYRVFFARTTYMAIWNISWMAMPT